ncbi:preQ(1) synthase [Legionella sp. PC1000]|uniref:NADPH-dependent 7-cyano-7-deazaguanine reductase n=2 Tax=Legionellaceae TaxID=444 RepID=A0ABS8X5G7_9GAMM|nr:MULTISPECIES: NADPH-dependent 7-cyano-7-deazaguanine reductase QueF [unclassified Legionella]MCE0724877.1 NADPH-dependent 7-cyano-7-deazaguanine reductase QueF [Legionella sp. 9fVS26]MCE3534031.1 NADPH-dependent 7-cyano-7-deazaguanine reductase QueF [Legionella sp. 8cVS16]QLZ70265.1 preQ(1) synthase [Legionella sp. PC1000]
MKYYQIKDISQMTSLTIRSLQYYDEIGLLKPTKRSMSGYRLYSETDLIRLQQITTLKFLGFSLSTIKKIMENPHFDVMASMGIQARELTEKAARINEAASLLTYISSQVGMNQPVNWKSTAKIIEILELNTMNDHVLKKYQSEAEQSELGKKSAYDETYNPDRLYPIPRAGKRQEIGVDPVQLPFYGFDCWNHYEVSWLNAKGKPMVAIAELFYDCSSPNLIESKSLKLYFNSFNNTRIQSVSELENTIKKDLQERVGAEVWVHVHLLEATGPFAEQQPLIGESLDDLDIECSIYLVEPSFLSVSDEIVEEALFSNLLKSNCLVTNQPDWGSVQITYRGKKINREGLLKYLVSYRNHNEFHEQCIERIFVDIMNYCTPEKLTVYGRYTRRGGLDINPYRSTEKTSFAGKNLRLVRQ